MADTQWSKEHTHTSEKIHRHSNIWLPPTQTDPHTPPEALDMHRITVQTSELPGCVEGEQGRWHPEWPPIPPCASPLSHTPPAPSSSSLLLVASFCQLPELQSSVGIAHMKHEYGAKPWKVRRQIYLSVWRGMLPVARLRCSSSLASANNIT